MLLADNSSGINCPSLICLCGQVFAQCTLALGTVWKCRAMVSGRYRLVMDTAGTLFHLSDVIPPLPHVISFRALCLCIPKSHWALWTYAGLGPL